MKNLITITLLLLSVHLAFAQKEKNVPADHHYYPVTKGKLGFAIMLTANEGAKNIDFNYAIPNQPNGSLTYLDGVKNIHLYGYAIKDSASFYRYTIKIDNDQIVTDAMLSNPIGDEPFAMPQYDLGKFNVENKKIEITYYKTGDKGNIGRSIIYSKPISPAKFNFVAFSKKNIKEGGSNIEAPESKDSIFKIDKLTRSMIFSVKTIDLDFIYTAYLIDKSTSEILYQSNNWEYASYVQKSLVPPYVVIPSKYFNKSGDYEIKVIPRLASSFRDKSFHVKTLVYNFTIDNIDEKLLTSKEIVGYGVLLSTIFGAILWVSITYIKKKGKQKIVAEQRQKAITKSQLDSIRSQLNPHFMFNALAGIQSLMNEQKTNEANQYLGKFARLTRNVLDNKELISLAEEKDLLDDYLQMEQLRFGFNYQINILEDVDLNTEIPAMLLQPFVENAVKHGIAEKSTAGEIKISFTKRENDLLLSISDNGNGFDTDKAYPGYGLQLSKNRIELLNAVYNETALVLEIKASNKGTEMTITLKQWL